jgi:hypothetical protein
MPLFNRRNKAGSGEGQMTHVGHTDPFMGDWDGHAAPAASPGNAPFSSEHSLTAHLNKFDDMTVQRGGKSMKPAGGFGADYGALFRKGK